MFRVNLNSNKGEYMKELHADNIKDGKRVPIMHGENWFMPIDKLPRGKRITCNKYIAGHSESGHNHILESDKPFTVVETDTERAVLLNEVTKLFHKKTFDVHETKFLAPGAYKIYKKTEYDPFKSVVRAVYD